MSLLISLNRIKIFEYEVISTINIKNYMSSKAEPMFITRQRKLIMFEAGSLLNNRYIKAVSYKIGKLLTCNPIPVCIMQTTRMRLASTYKYVNVTSSDPVVEIYRGPQPSK